MTLYQLKWMLKSLIKSVYFAAIISVLLVFLVIPSGAELDGSSWSRFMLLLSLSVDSLTTFIVASMGLSIGITVSTWNAVLLPVRINFKAHVTRALWAIAFSVFLVFVSIQSGVLVRTGFGGFYSGLSLLNMIVAATFGSSIAYKSYILYGTMERKERLEHTGKTKDGKLFVKTMKWFIPFVDRTRFWGSIVFGFLAVIIAVSLAGWSTEWIAEGNRKIGLAVAYPIAVSLFYAVIGSLIRVWDSIKPFGVRDSLYPRWETPQSQLKKPLTSEEKIKLDDA